MRFLRIFPLGVGLALIGGRALAADPTGYFDAADCNGYAGWAQDPDEPTKGIDVHLYLGGPAGSGAPAFATTANLYREDLCAAIGSCEHGFVTLTPLSLHDGQSRDIYAYAIDSMGGVNPQLGNSPKPFACAPVASGVLRRVVEIASVDAWKLNAFWDVLPLPAADAAALGEGADFPEAPELITPDDGSGALWLVDRGTKRAVAAAAIGPWRLFDKPVSKPAAEVQAMIEGPPLRPRPVLIYHQGLRVVDDPIPEVPAGEGGGGGMSGSSGGGGQSASLGGGGTGGVEEGGGTDTQAPSHSGCLFGGRGDAEQGWGAALIAGLIAARRRRRR